uniref:Uncharacterized protein n=1 Tax=Arundo donax TaxID=35708 RepID=A0A0A9C0P3_ARUDO
MLSWAMAFGFRCSNSMP